jgi:hypothetical protein
MNLSLLFWVLYILAIVLTLWADWPAGGTPAGFRPLGGRVIQFILIGILGWAQFGAAVHR